MQAFERYIQLYDRIDPSDPLVAEEIRKGMRWAYGETDVHHHLPRLREEACGAVLEIGVRFGSSTAALLLGLEEQGGHLWSVDTEPCEFARGLFDGHPQWTFVQGDSKIVTGLPEELDLLFIDGDHSYEGALHDLMRFGPRARTIMLHDANRRIGTPAVLDAIGQYLMAEGTPHSRLRCYTDSHGLAVIS